MRRLLGACATIAAAFALTPAVAGAQGINQQPDQTYVAMGDSYSSGNGTGDYYETNCYRSYKSYGPLIDPQIPGSFSHPACSGARTNHIDRDSQNGFPKQTDLLGPDTKYVSLSIGGNDAGFTDALSNCAVPFGGCTDDGGSLDQSEAFIRNQLPALLDRNYAAIRAKAPNATVTVLGYPRIFRPNQTCIAVFSTAEVNRANELADLLADVTRERALAAGFSFVDSRQAFIGHGSCDSSNWINEFSISDTSGSFHPTQSGYQSFAGMVRTSLLASPRPGQARGPNGRIAFASNRDGNSEVYVVNGNGDFPLDVTNDPGSDIDPAWSPDGKKLAFASNRDGDNELYVMDFDTGALTKLTNNASDDREPAWSPNGDLLAFRTDRDGNNEIYTVPSAGGAATRLTNNAASDFAPAWSPDGSEIAFQRFATGGNNEVWRMNADGQGQVNLTNNSANDGAPEWSPDGNSIAFHSNRDGDFEIFTMARAGTNQTQRTANSVDDRQPAWSPNGASVAFTSNRDGNDEVYTAPLAGAPNAANEVRRATSPQADDSPSWQGDGTPPRTTFDSGPTGTIAIPRPSFTFHSNEPGSTFACSVDGGSFSPCASPFTTSSLDDGDHTVRVRATDPSGNAESPASSRSFAVVLPKDATTIDSGPSGPTANRTPRFEFSSVTANTTFECRLDGAAFQPCSSPFDAPELSEGPHTFSVRGTPENGHTGQPIDSAFTVDVSAPVTALDTGPSGLTNVPNPSFEFSSSESGGSFECRLDSSDDGDWEACTSPDEVGPLTDGPHTFDVRARDAAGNVDASPESTQFVVDTAAPTTSLDPVPDRVTTSTPQFSFSSPDASAFECRIDSLDDADWAPCSSPLTTAPLLDGPHTFQVRATDEAGNIELQPATASFAIDATAPDTAIGAGPAQGSSTNDDTPSFAFSSPDDLDPSFECRIDSGAWSGCDGAYDAEHLGDGPHSFEVRAIDTFGNIDPSPARRDFTVDTRDPDTTILAGPEGKVKSADATFSYKSVDDEPVSFECRLDGGAWVSCPASYTGLANGPHSFEVRAVDAAGNLDHDPPRRDFDVRVISLDTTIGSGPSGPSNDASPSFSFASIPAGETLRCRLDTPSGAGAWGNCGSPQSYGNLTEQGAYKFWVKSFDAYGNEDPTPASRSFVLDTITPNVEITSLPARSRQPSVDYAFTNDDSSTAAQCRVDNGAWSPCTGHLVSQPDGPHTLHLRAVDAAGNVGSDSGDFEVDTRAPRTTLQAGPSGASPDPAPVFEFSADEGGASFECSLDGDDWTGCASPWSVGHLPDGQHEVEIRATDQAGNVEAAPPRRAFKVDTRAPDTVISSGPDGATRDAQPGFGFGADEPATTFRCSVDGGSFAACHSNAPLDHLADGPHTLRVVAVDEAGNSDPTPAVRDFLVDSQVSDPAVTVPRKVKAGKGKLAIDVSVGAGEAVTASATGTVSAGKKKVPLTAGSIDLQSRAKGALRLAAGRKGAGAVKRALAKGKKLKAQLSVTLTDQLGNTAVTQATVKLVPPKR